MAQAGTNRRPDSFDDAPNDRQAFLSSTDNLNPARFGSYSRLLVVLLFILLYVLVTLLALMLTGYLNNRTFNIDKIGLVSTVSAVNNPGGFRRNLLGCDYNAHS